MSLPDPSAVSVTCPGCRHRLWRQRRGDWSLGGRLLKLTGDGFVVICPDCATEVPVPFLQFAAPQSAPETPRSASARAKRLVVRVDGPRNP
jgi:hypothetical protein